MHECLLCTYTNVDCLFFRKKNFSLRILLDARYKLLQLKQASISAITINLRTTNISMYNLSYLHYKLFTLFKLFLSLKNNFFFFWVKSGIVYAHWIKTSFPSFSFPCFQVRVIVLTKYCKS